MDSMTKTVSDTLYALAMLLGACALIIGAVLVLHTTHDCASFVCIDVHPYVGLGVGIGVGGIVNASVIGALGKLVGDVGAIRSAVEILAGPDDDDEPAPNAEDVGTLYGSAD